MGTSTILLAAGIGAVIGWIAHTLVTEPDGPQRERHLIDAYSQGWHACESYRARLDDQSQRAGARRIQDARPATVGSSGERWDVLE